MQTLATAQPLARSIWIVLLLAICSGYSAAQSTDVAWPSPIRTNEVRATISARDLGDPRVTDHFYAFTGLPGDVLITVDSRNLNGDIDVFTSSNLRPLLKFTVYAGTSSLITKSIYLRKQEDLILRVEGRTPNDDEATYRLHFGGAFEPITSGPLAEHEDALQQSSVAEMSKGTKRVTSVGARIDEPPAEVAETRESPRPEPTPSAPTETTPKPVTTARSTTRNTRPRRPVTRKTRPVQPTKPADASKSDETVAKDETGERPTGDDNESKPTEVPERPARKSKTSRATPKPAPPEETEDSGPRLVIETSDGTLVNRSMSGVRRVTVENGQVVVIGKDGKIQKIPLASVVRMVIAP